MIPKSIAIGLVKAQAYARGVEKNGRSTQGGGYPYARSEDVIAEGRKSLIEGGRIGFAVTGWAFEAMPDTGPAKTKVGSDGKTKTLATATGRIKVKYLLVSLDEGDSYEAETSAPIVPEFGRPDDKAEYGALTECHAYTLRGLLNLPRGVEGAVDMNQRPDYGDGPEDARAPESPRDAPAERPAVSPGAVRAAADRAVESQVRGTPANVPIAKEAPEHDPAHVALCENFERRTLALTPGEDPNPLYDEINAAKLPEQLARRAFCSFFVGVFRAATTLKMLDQWVEFAMKTTWGAPYNGILKEETDKADARLAPAAA